MARFQSGSFVPRCFLGGGILSPAKNYYVLRFLGHGSLLFCPMIVYYVAQCDVISRGSGYVNVCSMHKRQPINYVCLNSIFSSFNPALLSARCFVRVAEPRIERKEKDDKR